MLPRQEFSRKTKAAAFERCGGSCEDCGAKLRPGKFVYDHIVPTAMGGDNSLENCRVRCNSCDKPKTAADQKAFAKVKRIRDKHTGAFKKRKGRGLPGNRDGKWKQKLDGTWVRRDE